MSHDSIRQPADKQMHQDPTDSVVVKTQAYLHARQHHGDYDSEQSIAWRRFFEGYRPLIRRFVAARGLRGEDLEDCLQEVWSEVTRRLAKGQFTGTRAGLRSWLYTVVRSKSADLLRRKYRTPALEFEGVVRGADEPHDREPPPSAEVSLQSAAAEVQRALAQLETQVSSRNYQIVQMRFLQGQSVAEVADRLQLSKEQVRYRQYRTLKKLRGLLRSLDY